MIVLLVLLVFMFTLTKVVSQKKKALIFLLFQTVSSQGWLYIEKAIYFLPLHPLPGEKLELFLRSLNSSKPLYLGQTGLGMAEELGRLALEPGENFCMGGPGMIFSREVLRRMVPHISTCLREMYTTHEDVEVGRCVRRFGGTQCVWSYEVRIELICLVFIPVKSWWQ